MSNSHESTGNTEPDTSYRVVFNGKIAGGHDAGDVKRNFSRLFKIDQSRLEVYFSGKPVVLKKGLNHQAAVSVVKALKETGILCTLESETEDGGRGTEDETPASVLRTLTCPKCGHVQQESEECSRCGLIFKKYDQARLEGDPGDCKMVIYDGVEGRKKKLLVFLSLLLAFVLYMESRAGRGITYPPGILINSEPKMALVRNQRPWKVGSREIFPLVEFWLQGRVLGSERYHDSYSDIYPIDIGLGWGPMSDQSIIDQLHIVQGHRKLLYEPSDREHPLPTFESLWPYVKNVHTCPADDDIKKKVFSVRSGDLIELRGYLIGIQENGQWTVVSSLKKEVGEDHTTCLVFWVTNFKWLDIESLKANRAIGD